MKSILKNSNVRDLLEYKYDSQESIQRIKAKDSLTDARINRLEDSVLETNRYLASLSTKGTVDKEELLKLLVNKAERDLQDG